MIKDENYLHIGGWMITKLGLKGNSLICFAIIYGFSQDGESEFTGSIGYLCEWLNVSRPTVSKALDELVQKGLILKTQTERNRVKFNTYKVNLPLVKNLYGGSKESLQGSKETLQGGSKETLHNILDTRNTSNNTSNNTSKKDSKKDSVDYQAIANAYNETCVSLPSCRSLSDQRKKAIKARLNNGYTVDDFTKLFEKAQASDFLKGKNDRSWTATFDWLIKDSNMAKVLDGNYDNRGAVKRQDISTYRLKGAIEI